MSQDDSCIGRSAYEALGASRETSDRMVAEFNALDGKAMIEVADAFDINIPPHENDVFVARVRKMVAEWEPEVEKKITAIFKSET